ncbi:conserved hypothetical protein [Vibrio nigripulchritudo SOn1]|uniref:Chemotaxis methyl-accepting receptor HlyB-like 4HB MCP domain-containing protein n=1 Tax=Vibrio nigripulchritudo SOn1 TaxID=1238450 RepID=A0AAV2VPF9_9VIBR|nr:hypothetical protein [Vibrio nigripulchritudo]CCO46418.1 conserved hypothetical protein [Vibrio nigripulchritudo SOn1]
MKLKEQLDNKELKSSGFWLNQVFMIVSTIVGVYLAAQSGLQQALTFDTYSKMEDNYYLRMSLHDELSDNTRDLQAYIKDYLMRNAPAQELKDNRPDMSKYIWETMKYNPTTLETPNEILTSARRFYSQTDDLLNRALARRLGANYAGQQLQIIVDDMQQNTLPYIAASADQLKIELSKNGVEIGAIKGDKS